MLKKETPNKKHSSRMRNGCLPTIGEQVCKVSRDGCLMSLAGGSISDVWGSDGAGMVGPSKVRINTSWVIVTWGCCGQNGGQTPTKTLPSHNSVGWGPVKILINNYILEN